MNYFVGKNIFSFDIEKLSNEELVQLKKYIVKKKFKHASHLIRLLKMAIEYLNEGVLYVERKLDAKYLLDIKKGEYTLDQVKKESYKLFKLAEESYIRSTLPNEPDYEKINKLCIDILQDYLK